MTDQRSAAIPPEEGTMENDTPVRNWQEWAEQHSEAADILRRLRDALEAAAGGYGPVTDEQRNEWLALVAEVDGSRWFVRRESLTPPEEPQDSGDSAP